MDILMNLRDEAYTRVVDELSDMITSGETIRNEEEKIRRFSEQMIYVKEIIIKLQSQQSGGQFTCSFTTANLLRRIEIAVNNARETIEGYKSKSSLLRLLLCRSIISILNQSYKEIVDVLSLLPSTDIGISLNIYSNLDAIIHSLKSIEHKLEENTKTIQSRLDLYISEYSDPSLLPLIEAKEVKIGEPINEANQFTKMLECFSSEMEPPIQREKSTVDEIVNLPNIFFYCPFALKLLEDPVNVSCKHSYERKAVEDYFRSGHKICLLCNKELMFSFSGKLELTPNPTLLNIISEWKQRNVLINAEKNAKKKLRDAAERINFDNMESTNQALEELKAVMNEMSSCISEATDSFCKLVQKLAELLKKSAGTGNAGLVLWCLLFIICFSQENKVRTFS
ncbi:E3 ubiquitin-protein ligase SPL11 [Dendrobium catenatum]|uniref:E3 ubiquitin-protein ligase SPL11 n=1 Tax=Dendrobium catenatum TaxID=906689 RepID=A0A2I0X5T6_9ASPA|nr:E3 ubiquitin-protein ligase SPL11 [Dendrobium catenatum]